MVFKYNSTLNCIFRDAIVNPANNDLFHAGGAARAISDAAGQEFEDECKKYIADNMKLPTGSAMKTKAGGSLKCHYVIHAVGPRYNNQKTESFKEDKKLGKSIEASLNIMKDNNLADICIPAISTGIYGFPLSKCVEIFGTTIRGCIDEYPQSFSNKEIIICNLNVREFT